MAPVIYVALLPLGDHGLLARITAKQTTVRVVVAGDFFAAFAGAYVLHGFKQPYRNQRLVRALIYGSGFPYADDAGIKGILQKLLKTALGYRIATVIFQTSLVQFQPKRPRWCPRVETLLTIIVLPDMEGELHVRFAPSRYHR